METLNTEQAAVLPSSSPEQQGLHTPLSKKAQKKLLKAERIKAQKPERRAREKAAKKEKRRERAAAAALASSSTGQDEDDEDDAAVRMKRAVSNEDDGDDTSERRERKRAKLSEPKKPFRARVVVDLGFDSMMSDKEVTSLCSQLAYTYSANRKASCPFASLLFTSLNGRTYTRLESLSDASYKRWSGTEWWNRGYQALWDETDETGDQKVQTVPSWKSEEQSDRDKVVYLTADSGEELSELREDETYIVGGICDHNRYKNLCENKAKADGIRSARLPIGTYMSQLQTRKVLTVNQVFEILLWWIETRDWEKALYKVVPKRKFHGSPQESIGISDKAPINESAALDASANDLDAEVDMPHSVKQEESEQSYLDAGKEDNVVGTRDATPGDGALSPHRPGATTSSLSAGGDVTKIEDREPTRRCCDR